MTNRFSNPQPQLFFFPHSFGKLGIVLKCFSLEIASRELFATICTLEIATHDTYWPIICGNNMRKTYRRLCVVCKERTLRKTKTNTWTSKKTNSTKMRQAEKQRNKKAKKRRTKQWSGNVQKQNGKTTKKQLRRQKSKTTEKQKSKEAEQREAAEQKRGTQRNIKAQATE